MTPIAPPNSDRPASFAAERGVPVGVIALAGAGVPPELLGLVTALRAAGLSALAEAGFRGGGAPGRFDGPDEAARARGRFDGPDEAARALDRALLVVLGGGSVPSSSRDPRSVTSTSPSSDTGRSGITRPSCR